MTWKKIRNVKAYNNKSRRCNLCTNEKYYILFRGEMGTLNKRTELLAACRHKRKFTLKEYS